MSRRYSDLDDLIHDLDSRETLSDDNFGGFNDEDLEIMGAITPDIPRVKPKPKPAVKRGRPKKKS